jgi:hypothetical protein
MIPSTIPLNRAQQNIELFDVQEVNTELFSIEQVFNLSENLIVGLSEKQLEKVDDFLTDHPDQLFEMVQKYPGEIDTKWKYKLFALRKNEYISQDQAHVMIISSTINRIDQHNFEEVNKRQFAALAEAKEQREKFQASQDFKKSEIKKELSNNKKEIKDLKKEAEEISKKANPINDQNEAVSNPSKSWKPYIKTALVIGGLVLAYFFFKSKGSTPTSTPTTTPAVKHQ